MRKIYLSVLLLLCAVAAFGQHLVRLGRYSIVPQQNVHARWTRSTQSSLELGLPTNGKLNVLIQFKSYPNADQLKKIAQKGVKLQDYLGSNAYFASIKGGSHPSDFMRTTLRSVIPIEPEWKLGELLQSGRIPEWARRGDNRISVLVRCFEDGDLSMLRALASDHNWRITKSLDSIKVASLELLPSDLQILASQNWVASVNLGIEPTALQNHESLVLGRGNLLRASTDVNPHGRALTGRGVTVGIWDGNIHPHPDFGNRLLVQEFELPMDVSGGHGIHVAGTLSGAGLLDPLGTGIAPGARIVSRNFGDQSNGLSFFEEVATVYAQDGISISQNSWGPNLKALCDFYEELSYSALSSQSMLDEAIVRYPDVTQVFAVGNYQGECGYKYSSTAARSKNAIYVGAIDRRGEVTEFSSFGPFDDGRITPIVCAKGEDVYSTMVGNSYAVLSGTSMACPSVSGHIALLTERFRQLNPGHTPRHDLLKAIVANSADDAGRPGPDYEYGFGILNAEEALNVLENGFYLDSTISRYALNHTIGIPVPKGVKSLKVMLTWIDPVSKKQYAYGEPALVNDLDLSVTLQGTTYLPWTLDKDHPDQVAQRAVNLVDPIEQVSIDNPPAGSATVTIGGSRKIRMHSKQRYILTWCYDYEDARITFPYGGECFAPGETILLKSDRIKSPARVEIGYNQGSEYRTIASGDVSTLPITIPKDFIPTESANIRIIDVEGKAYLSEYFTVMPIPQNVRLEDSPCDMASWRLMWSSVSGATSYNILKADVPTGKFTQIASVSNVDNYLIPTQFISEESRNLFAVEAVQNGVVSRRSKGVLALASSPLRLSQSDLPFIEFFQMIPTQHVYVGLGSQLQTEFVEAPPAFSHGMGARVLATKALTNAPDWTSPFDHISTHGTSLQLCKLDLTQIAPATKLSFVIYYLMATQKTPRDGQIRLLVNGSPIANSVGQVVTFSDEDAHELSWDLSSYVGQEISLELQSVLHTVNSQMLLLYVALREQPEVPDVSLAALTVPKPAERMGEEDVTVLLVNKSNKRLPSTPINITIDGKQLKSLSVRNLKPFEERKIVTKIDFTTHQKIGHKFQVRAEVSLTNDPTPSDNVREAEVYNMGPVTAMKPMRLETWLGITFPADPMVTVNLEKEITITDMGGGLENYGWGHRSSQRFLPATPLFDAAQLTIDQLELADQDTLFIWESHMPDNFTTSELPDYTLTSRDNGRRIVALSRAKEGDVTIKLKSSRDSESASGWMGTVRPVSKSNLFTLQSVRVDSHYPNEKATIWATIHNNTPTSIQDLKLILTSPSLNNPVVFPLHKIEEKADYELEMPEIIDLPFPTRTRATVRVAGFDTEGRDNEKEISLVNDRYWTGGEIAKSGLYLNYIQTVKTVDRSIEFTGESRFNQYISYYIDSTLTLYKGSPNLIDITLGEPVTIYMTDAKLYVWLDLDGDDGDFKDSEPEMHSIQLVDGQQTYRIAIDLSGVANLKNGAHRIRFLLAPEAEMNDFKTGGSLSFGRAFDLIAQIQDGAPANVNDLAILSITQPHTGEELTTNEHARLLIRNNGIYPITNVEVKLALDGGAEIMEQLSLPIPPMGGEVECSLTKTLDLSRIGPHTIRISLEDDDDNSNNILEKKVYSIPRNSATDLYALNFIGREDEALVVQPNTWDIDEYATIEGWFYFPKSQHAKLVTGDGLEVVSTYRMNYGIPDNALVIRFGDKQVGITEGNIIKIGQWNHIALAVKTTGGMILGATEANLFVNNQNVALHMTNAESKTRFTHLQFGRGFTGMIKNIRIWKWKQELYEISPTIDKLLQTPTGLPAGLCAEFFMNEGRGGAVSSVNQNFAQIESDRIDAVKDNIWQPIRGLISEVSALGQVSSKRLNDGSFEILMPYKYQLDYLFCDFKTKWPGCELRYNGSAVSESTHFDFSSPDHTFQVEIKRTDLFGQTISENFTVKVVKDKRAEAELKRIDLLMSDNPNLKSDESKQAPGQTILLKAEDMSPTQQVDIRQLKVRITDISTGAKAVYNGQEAYIGETLTLDLREPKMVDVVAANGKRRAYMLRLSRPQQITWTSNPIVMTYGDISNELSSAITTTGQKVQFSVKDNSIVTRNKDGKLQAVGVGETEVTAFVPDNGLYSPASTSRKVTVKPSDLELQLYPVSQSVGGKISYIPYKLIGLKFNEDKKSIKVPEWGFFDSVNNLVDTLYQRFLPGVYTIKPVDGKLTYSDGNYNVSIKPSQLTVTPSDRFCTINLTIKDKESDQPISGVSFRVVDGDKLIDSRSDAEGKLTLSISSGDHLMLVSKDGYASIRDTIIIRDTAITSILFLEKLRYTITYSTGPNGSILGDLTQLLPEGGTGKKVVAFPDPGYQFVRWLEDDLSDSARQEQDVRASQTYTALFGPESVIVTFACAEGGTIVTPKSTQRQEVVKGGATQKVEVWPLPGYLFDGWSDGEKNSARILTNVQEPQAVIAYFRRPHAINYTQNFDLIRAIPPFWSEDHSQSAASYHWRVDLPKSKYALPSGFKGNVAVLPVNQQIVSASFKDELMLPYLSISNIDEPITLSYRLYFEGSAGESLKLYYRFDGEEWEDANTITPSADIQELTYSLNSDRFRGKYMVQFMWRYTSDSPGKTIAIDDVNVTRDNPTHYNAMYIVKSDGHIRLQSDRDPRTRTEILQVIPIGQKSEPVLAIPDDPAQRAILWKPDRKMDNPRTDNADTYAQVEFDYSADTYSLLYRPGDHGRIEGLVYTDAVQAGYDGPTIRVIPEEGYLFREWSDSTADNPRVDREVSRNIEVTALYGKPYRLYFADPENGALIISRRGESLPTQSTIVEGDRLTITAPPQSARYFLKSLMVNGDSISDGDEITVEGDIVVEATFDLIINTIPYNLTLFVLHDGNPVSGATIEIAGQQYSSDSEGKVTLSLTNGNYIAHVSKESFYQTNLEAKVMGTDLTVKVNLHKTSLTDAGPFSSTELLPNPVMDVLQLRNIQGVEIVQIYTIAGILVDSHLTHKLPELTLNVDHLDEGIYNLVLVGNHERRMIPFVKSR